MADHVRTLRKRLERMERAQAQNTGRPVNQRDQALAEALRAGIAALEKTGDAPRFHSGGVVGLKPGEVPAILSPGCVLRGEARGEAHGGPLGSNLPRAPISNAQLQAVLARTDRARKYASAPVMGQAPALGVTADDYDVLRAAIKEPSMYSVTTEIGRYPRGGLKGGVDAGVVKPEFDVEALRLDVQEHVIPKIEEDARRKAQGRNRLMLGLDPIDDDDSTKPKPGDRITSAIMCSEDEFENINLEMRAIGEATWFDANDTIRSYGFNFLTHEYRVKP